MTERELAQAAIKNAAEILNTPGGRTPLTVAEAQAWATIAVAHATLTPVEVAE